MKNEVKIHEVNPFSTNRRSFLKISGLGAVGAGLLLAGCSDDDDSPIYTPPVTQYPGVRNGVFDLGGGDFGVLTYAYALEQLEAEFYTRVVNNSNFNALGQFSASERDLLVDIYNHEVIHREFFKAALGGALPDPSTQLLPALAFDFGGLDFSNRTAVLSTAQALEDTGVGAYNGAGKLISDVNYLLIAGKIVSVEARHASAIRQVLNGGTSFAGDDIVNASSGLDTAKLPSQVAPVASGFITTEFTANYLP